MVITKAADVFSVQFFHSGRWNIHRLIIFMQYADTWVKLFMGDNVTLLAT